MNALCPAVDRPVAGLGPEQQEPTLTLARGPSVIGTCSPNPVGEAAKLLSQRAYYSNLEERGRRGESKAFTVMLLVIRDLQKNWMKKNKIKGEVLLLLILS